jgi:hypothetical protein
MSLIFASPPRPPKRYWHDSDWLDAHDAELTELYPNQWVAVLSEKVISHGTSLQQVLEEVEKQGAAFPVIGFVEKGIHVYKNIASLQDEI